MSIHVNTDLLNAAKATLAMLEAQGLNADALRAAVAASDKPAKKRTKQSTDPNEQSPYAPSRFLPLKRYTASMRGWEHPICEVTFADGTKVRAYAFREPNKPMDIGRPARTAVEKYRFKNVLIEKTQGKVFCVPYTDAVPEIVELRDTETGNIFDIAAANHGTAQMREKLA